MTDKKIASLCLVMIVKNEAEGIADTLRSVKGCIDNYAILDTGSEDQTVAIIQRELQGVEGRIYSGEFVNFEVTRNEALELGKASGCSHALLLDADNILDGAGKLHEWINREAVSNDIRAYEIPVVIGDTYFQQTKIVGLAGDWKFKGLVHEVLISETQSPEILQETVRIRHCPKEKSQKVTQERWKKDIEILKKQVEGKPEDSRTVFYLALTFYWLGDKDEAEHYFWKRIRLNGWSEEVFESYMHLARISVGPEYYLKYAMRIAPHRAEPLVELAEFHRTREDWTLSRIYALAATEIGYPEKDRLFIQSSCYTWKAWDLVAIASYYLAQILGRESKLARKIMSEGRIAASNALKYRREDARLIANLRHFDEMYASGWPALEGV